MYKYFKSRVVISVILALTAMYLTYTFLSKSQQMEDVVVPIQAIEPYTKITTDMLQIEKINSRDKTEFYPNAVNEMSDLDGAITRVRLEKSKPIEKTEDKFVVESEKLMALNSQGGVNDAYFIPYDKRIIGVSVDDSGSINKRLKSGDFVDVIFTSKDDANGGIFSNMILQHLQVYSVDMAKDAENLSDSGKEKINILLLATPEECLKLSVSKRNGVIDLVLNPLNGETKGIEPVNIFQLSAEKPLSKSDKLTYLEETIKQDEISGGVKKELLDNLEKERQVDVIINAISASKLSQEKKDDLLNLLK